MLHPAVAHLISEATNQTRIEQIKSSRTLVFKSVNNTPLIRLIKPSQTLSAKFVTSGKITFDNSNVVENNIFGFFVITCVPNEESKTTWGKKRRKYVNISICRLRKDVPSLFICIKDTFSRSQFDPCWFALHQRRAEKGWLAA